MWGVDDVVGFTKPGGDSYHIAREYFPASSSAAASEIAIMCSF